VKHVREESIGKTRFCAAELNAPHRIADAGWL